MKNKAPLSLMEQLVMLLVFSLAAALCLQVFVLSAQISRRCEARDRAVTEVQNAAEALKVSGGDLQRCADLLGGIAEDGCWELRFDENWEAALSGGAYCLTAEVLPAEYPALGSAEVTARTASGEELFGVTVCWQEVTGE